MENKTVKCAFPDCSVRFEPEEGTKDPKLCLYHKDLFDFMMWVLSHTKFQLNQPIQPRITVPNLVPPKGIIIKK